MPVKTLRSLFDVENPGLVGLMSFSHGFNEFFSIIVPPLFPYFVPRLGMDYSEASLLVVVFFLTYSVCQLPIGPFADVYDNQKILVCGMSVLALGISLVAISTTYPVMVLGMIIAGIGGSTYHPTGMALISDNESNETYGRSMGVHGTLGSLGTVVAPLVVVTVAETSGWRSALLTGSALGLFFSLILYVAYPMVSPKNADDESPNFVTAIRQTFHEELDRQAILDNVSTYLLSREIIVLGLLFLVVGAEVRAVQTFTASFAVSKTGLEESFGGTMLSITMVTAGLASMFAGVVVDKLDRDFFAAATFAGTGVTIAILVYFPLDLIQLTAGFVVLGGVLYGVYPATNAMAAATSVTSTSGSLFAVTNTASAVGGAAGAYILGIVADVTTIQHAFFTTSAIAAVGVLIVIVARIFD